MTYTARAAAGGGAPAAAVAWLRRAHDAAAPGATALRGQRRAPRGLHALHFLLLHAARVQPGPGMPVLPPHSPVEAPAAQRELEEAAAREAEAMRERMASEVRMSKELPVEAPAAAQPRHAGKHSSHPTPSRDDGHGNGGSALPPKGAPTTPSGNAAPGEQGGGVMLDGVQCSSQSGVAAFGYYPAQATLTIGQETAFRPQLASKPCRFRPLTQMPKGLVLDPASGVISGAPAEAVTQTVMFIEAEFSNGGVGRAVVEFEVVDLTRGGFVVGHVSEFEPGMFMMLLYIPDGDEPGYSAVPPHLHGGTGNMKGLAPWDGRTAVQKSVASMGQPVIWPQAMSCGRALGQLSNGHSPSQNVAWGRECPSSEDWW
eukprot:CAMPEP_0179079778 /NCGR_PEP_ID=MMETSP0796-20121207/35816_1 /TAXON_ID=73915 /ORGANISM="Pyrodinium bahamense, Strain pbaha01" /LENGTH=370 /DNA_ID=CAMNT_0020777121 /DNA_START=25 /DNA_END=1139 /DNA_ORIENTATION=-